MELEQRKKGFVQFGKIALAIGENREWPGFSTGVDKAEYDDLDSAVKQAHHHNGWFTEKSVRSAFFAWGKQLTEDKLSKWLLDYRDEFVRDQNKTVGIVMAGNIPLVGFHDLLTVVVSGFKAKVKLSSDDKLLMNAVIHLLKLIDPGFENKIEIASDRLLNLDAVMATGSNNTARYFEYYFSHIPNVIRKNRSSVAILKGDESAEGLHLLGRDIFAYFGLGCRNVSKMYIPKSYDLDTFFKGIYEHKDVIEHHKYANNYDYNKTVWLMNKEVILDNGFVLLKEEPGLTSPLGSVYYERYSDIQDVEKALAENEDQLQCVVGQGHLPFGKTQEPELWDYADGANTLDFLKSIR